MTAQRHVVTGLRAGQGYEVRVRAIAGLTRGPWASTESATGAPDTTPPGIPTGLAATGVVGGVALAWTNPADDDLKWIEVQESAAEFGTYTTIGQTGGTAFLRPGMVAGSSLWFRVRAVDASGNASGWTAAIEGTAGGIDADDLADGSIIAAKIADGAVEIAKFASGLRPVEIVGTLPASGNFAGRTVFLTSDGKIYRHQGSPAGAAGFTAVVPAADITGQIGTTQISDSAISTPKLAANAVTAAKIAASAVTAGKIAAGAVSATEIAAEAVRARHLFIGDRDNILFNPTFSQGLEDWTRVFGDVTAQTSGIPAGAPAPTALRMIRATTECSLTHSADFNTDTALSGGIPIRTGDELYAEAWVRCSVAGANDIFDLPIRTLAGDIVLAAKTVILGSATLAANTWTRVGFRFVATINGRGYLRLQNSVNSSTLWVTALVYRRRAAGELIVDGAITAAKLAAGEIITSSAQLGSAVVTNAKIGNLEVDTIKVANNAITTTSAGSWAGTHSTATWTTRVTLAAGDSFGGTLVILATITGTPTTYAEGQGENFTGGTVRILRMRVLRGGSVIGSWEGRDGILSITTTDTPAAQQHSYSLQVQVGGAVGGSGGAQVHAAAMAILQARK